MSFSFCSIASGSSGNCYVVKSEKTTLLVDVGISGKKIFEGSPDQVKVNQEVQSAYFGRGLVAGEALK